MEEGTFLNGTSDKVCCPRIQEDEQNIYNNFKSWFEVWIQLLIVILGMMSSMISMSVLVQVKFRRNIFCQLLLFLAISDFVESILGLFDNIALSHGRGIYLYMLLTPYLLYGMKAVTLTCSIFTMMSLALERHIAVYRPFTRAPSSQSSLYVCRYIIPVIMFSFILNIPKFLCFTITSVTWDNVEIAATQLRTNNFYINYYSWIRLIFLGILPVIWLFVFNMRIYLAIQKLSTSCVEEGLRRHTLIVKKKKTTQIELTNKRMSNMMKKIELTNNKSMSKMRTDQVQFIILISIVLTFLLCNIPRLIILMHEVVIIDIIRCCIEEGRTGDGFPFWNLVLGGVSEAVLMFNPTANFIVYCAFNTKFRNSIYEIFIRKKKTYCDRQSLKVVTGTEVVG